jgi:hypothetical protein
VLLCVLVYRTDDARHDDGAAGAPANGRRVVEIDTRRGRSQSRSAVAAVLFSLGGFERGAEDAP